MRTPKTLATSLLSLSAAALLALSAAGAASAAPAPGKAPTETSGVTQPHRRRDRRSGVLDGGADAQRHPRRRAGRQGHAAERQLHGRPEPAGRGRGARARSRPRPRALQAKEVQPKANASETPVKHIGKVFFTLGGANYVCSGNSVSSTNKSTVSTAGHCLNEGPGAFATKFTFVPAYLNGAAPYGMWTAKALYAPTQWSSGGDMTYDTGFAVMNTLNGQNLADVVGASGVQFNAARGLTYKAFGYPAAAPFNGESLKSCSGTATNDPYNPQFNTQGIPCNMTGGSSGGPWFIGTSSTGYQNSVNSYGYGSKSTTMYGPYWGSVIQQAYSTAAAS